MRERILITGPDGRVGPHILPLLRKEFTLRLLDIKRLTPEDDDEVIQADIRDIAALREACRGVQAMIHLAAIPDEDDFHAKLLPMNLAGVYNAFEAARQAQVPKVLFASTGQTVVNYGNEVPVTTDMPARPCTVYACTKLFGEALARHYSDNHGLSMICLRICWFQGYESPLLRKRSHLTTHWCSPRDLAQLMVKCLRADLRFGIFFGISNNTGRTFDVSNARRLVGYEPRDNSADYLESRPPV